MGTQPRTGPARPRVVGSGGPRLLRRALTVVGAVLAVSLAAACAPSGPEIPDDLTGAEITMSRGACHGLCPDYDVTIHGDGRVVYQGNQFVEITGRQERTIGPDAVRDLIDAFHEAGFFGMEDEYTGPITDMPTTIVTISIGGEDKSVLDYFGAPDELRRLERRIDEIAGTAEWIGD